MSHCFAVLVMSIMNENMNTKISTQFGLIVIIKHTLSKLQCFVLIALLKFHHSKYVEMHIIK